MSDNKAYEKIEEVLREAGRPLAAHEFDTVTIRKASADLPGSGVTTQDGRSYVGQSESSIARRLRELHVAGRVVRRRREGKQFVEFKLVGAGA